MWGAAISRYQSYKVTLDRPLHITRVTKHHIYNEECEGCKLICEIDGQRVMICKTKLNDVEQQLDLRFSEGQQVHLASDNVCGRCEFHLLGNYLEKQEKDKNTVCDENKLSDATPPPWFTDYIANMKNGMTTEINETPPPWFSDYMGNMKKVMTAEINETPPTWFTDYMGNMKNMIAEINETSPPWFADYMGNMKNMTAEINETPPAWFAEYMGNMKNVMTAEINDKFADYMDNMKNVLTAEITAKVSFVMGLMMKEKMTQLSEEMTNKLSEMRLMVEELRAQQADIVKQMKLMDK